MGQMLLSSGSTAMLAIGYLEAYVAALTSWAGPSTFHRCVGVVLLRISQELQASTACVHNFSFFH